MSLQGYIIGIVIVCALYFLYLINRRKYRLLIPSTVHTFTWMSVGVLFLWLNSNQNTEGWFVHPISDYDLVIPFIFYLVMSSIIGFTLSHIFFPHPSCSLLGENEQYNILTIDHLDYLLRRYHWILYVCFILGCMQAAFLYSAVGFESLGDYRVAAVTLKRTGYGAFAQQFSGHAAILGAFYIVLFGFKHGKTHIVVKDFILNAFLFSVTNIAIAGRGWIVTATLPYITAYLLGRFYREKENTSSRHDFIKITIIITFLLSSFSIIGMLRGAQGEIGNRKQAIEKFLYYVDGSYMTNIVFRQYPDGSFPLEWGKSEFLSKWAESPMAKKFAKSIEDDIGLSVTVKSTMPYLYYDFGYWGGIFMWGVFCFILESICSRLRRPTTVLQLFLFAELARLLYQAPVGHIFGMETPVMQWLIILYFFRKHLFSVNTIEENEIDEGCDSL